MADATEFEKTSQEFSDGEEQHPKEDSIENELFLYRILLKKSLADDEVVYEAAKSFKVSIIVLDDDCSGGSTPSIDNDDQSVVSFLVLDSFEGISHNNDNYRILGKTALLELAEKKEMLENVNRPLYCHAMSGLIVCLTGFKKKDEVNSVKQLIHHMGGSVRKDMSCRITHLIAKEGGGDKYYYALTFRVPVVMDSWVYQAWENKHIVGFQASDTDFILQHRLKPFQGTKICFLGFPEEERSHMIDILQENGGVSTSLADNTATHIVVDESILSAVPPLESHRTFVVKANWFWASVQNEGREKEANYKFDSGSTILQSGSTSYSEDLNNSTPLSSNNRNRKRKRLRSRFPSSNDLSPGQLAQKRRSSISDATRLSDDSLLDYTASPDIADSTQSPIREKNKISDKRYHRFLELCETESNYVNILQTIMSLFKSPLDEKVETDTQLLNATELKIIFGNLPPIYYVHKNMLEELKELASHWKETASIGKLFLKHSDELVKAYIPFINFFEDTRNMLIKCDRSNPRFHAFLKICQTKPECGRETLQDLLIRPVQRLPSVTLLLNDILRHTPKNNPDYNILECAITSMEQVMVRMNEDKRRTEGQVALFDIFNDIDNCPVHLVSSQRCFISKCDVIELSDTLSGRGNSLVLFMFSDVVEIGKKKTKAFNTIKSPKENSTMKQSNIKFYKHVKLLSISSIKKVIDITETDDFRNVFSLVVNDEESKKEIYSFKIVDESMNKIAYLRSLCRQIATNACKTDAENYFTTLGAQELDISSCDASVSTGTLGRAFNKFATKTKLKVGRAFSFNKTPSKLKRAVSTMMSPLSNHHQLTPSTDSTNLQLVPFSMLPVKFWK